MQEVWKRFSRYTYLITLVLISHCAIAKALHWEPIQPGLDYLKITKSNRPWASAIHAFRISLKRYNLDLIFAKDLGLLHAPIKHIAILTHALIAINGGFFSPEFNPLGLRIKNGTTRNKLKRVSWWGVFYIRRHRAYAASQRRFRYNRKITFAVQGGPRLVVNGRIPPLKPGIAQRSALGITRKGEVIILVTENNPMTTTALAKLMRSSNQDGGLGCINALNLDGGSSSQLYAKIGTFELNVPNFKLITDSVVVLPR